MISTNFLFRQFYDDAESISFMASLKKFVNLFNKILERDKNETHKEIRITQKKNLGALKEVIRQIEDLDGNINHSELGTVEVFTYPRSEDENLIDLVIKFTNSHDANTFINLCPTIIDAKYTKNRHKRLYLDMMVNFSKTSDSDDVFEDISKINNVSEFKKIFGIDFNAYKKLFSEYMRLDVPEIDIEKF